MIRMSKVLVVATVLAQAPATEAQSQRPWTRVTFTAQSFTASEAGQALPGFSELVVAATMASPTTEDRSGTEFRVDFRGAGYPQTVGRFNRLSVYDAYAGRRFASGLGVRFGQMWINDLGGLGALGGALVEVARPHVLGYRRVRVGAFAGVEPQILDAGYVKGVTKAGGYATFEGNGAWRNTVGFVTIRDAGLTERAVVTTTNFLPLSKRLFVYQIAELDLVGPAGNGKGGLTFLFTNARYTPISRLEFQGVYHRGRSIDTRGITLDQLAGRPVSAKALEGLLYESIGGRATVTAATGLRLFAGYTRDRNNREDAPTNRVTFGAFTSNLLRTGFDLNVSDSRMSAPAGSYDAWDVSLGHSLGPRMYVTADYSTALSTFRILGQETFLIESRPRTNRYSVSDLLRMTRRMTLLASVDRTRDGDIAELRWLLSLICRF